MLIYNIEDTWLEHEVSKVEDLYLKVDDIEDIKILEINKTEYEILIYMKSKTIHCININLPPYLNLNIQETHNYIYDRLNKIIQKTRKNIIFSPKIISSVIENSSNLIIKIDPQSFRSTNKDQLDHIEYRVYDKKLTITGTSLDFNFVIPGINNLSDKIIVYIWFVGIKNGPGRKQKIIINKQYSKIEYKVNNYCKYQDWKSHSIKVDVFTTGCVIKYGYAKYNTNLSTCPTFSDPGYHKIYFQITKPGYKTIYDYGIVEIKPSRIPAPIITNLINNQEIGTLSKINVIIDPNTFSKISTDTLKEIKYELNDNQQTITGSSKTYSFNISNWINLHKTFTLNVWFVGNKLGDGPKTTVILKKKIDKIEYTVTNYEGVIDWNLHSINISPNVSSPEYSYKLSKFGDYDLTNLPKFSDVGEYFIYFKINKENYYSTEGVGTVNILPGIIPPPNITSIANNQKISTTSDIVVNIDRNSFKPNTNDTLKEIKYELCTLLDEVVKSNTYNSSTFNFTITDWLAVTDIFLLKVWFIGNKLGDGEITTLVLNKTTGNIEYSITNYTGVIDWQPHSISLSIKTAKCTVLYKTSANAEYTLNTLPTFTEVGTYTVYFKISTAGSPPVEDYGTVEINEASIPAPIILSPSANSEVATANPIQIKIDPNSFAPNTPDTLKEIKYQWVDIFDETIVDSSSTYTFNINALYAPDEFEIIFWFIGNKIGEGIKTKLPLLKKVLRINYTIVEYEGLYDGQEHTIKVTVHSPEDCSIVYKTSTDPEEDFELELPTFTEVGDHRIYVMINKFGYEPVEKEVHVNILEPIIFAPVIISPSNYMEINSDELIQISIDRSSFKPSAPDTLQEIKYELINDDDTVFLSGSSTNYNFEIDNWNEISENFSINIWFIGNKIKKGNKTTIQLIKNIIEPEEPEEPKEPNTDIEG